MYNSTCESWQSCHNTDGWYSCVNTCDSNPCHEHASCTDTNEGYECSCNQGYVGNGMDCGSKYISLFLSLYVNRCKFLFDTHEDNRMTITKCIIYTILFFISPVFHYITTFYNVHYIIPYLFYKVYSDITIVHSIVYSDILQF